MGRLNIKINGKDLEAEEGSTILDVARANGIHIPTLCYHPQLSIHGGCRICMVEVKGLPKPVTSCTTPVAKDMDIQTDTPVVIKQRETVLELLLSDHPLECPVCDAGGDCRLQDLTHEYGIKGNRFNGERRNVRVEEINPFIRRDYQRCIQCGRCIRVCDEVRGVGAVQFARRGFHQKVSVFADKVLDCTFCGSCVQQCPVGALTEKPSKFRYRPWETKKVDTTCTFCGVGCSLTLHTKDNRIVRVTSREEGTLNKGHLCVKGKYGYEFVNSEKRLTSPLMRKDGNLVPASWSEALSYVAKRFKETKEKSGPDSLGGLSSAKCTNEENYLFQKFVRVNFGTNNVDNYARLTHASSVNAMYEAFGSGAMTNSLHDLDETDVFLVAGSNTTEAHPIIGMQIWQAVRHKKKKLIIVDPREIELTKYATMHLRPKPGTTVAVFNGLARVILEEGLVDSEFIKSRTEGFEEAKEIIMKYTPEVVEKISGVPSEQLIEAARLYGNAGKAAIYWSKGVSGSADGAKIVHTMTNLAMMTGNVGKPGAGVNPLLGQNNVQGACDMGCMPDAFPGYMPVNVPENREALENAWGIKLSEKEGLTASGMINSMLNGGIKGLYIIGENPVMNNRDRTLIRKALAALDFLVVQDIFLTETAEMADVVFPAAAFAEKDGTFTNTERRIQRVRKATTPPGHAWDDSRIITALSGEMGYPMEDKSSSDIMDEIASVASIYRNVSYGYLDKGAAVHWPCNSAVSVHGSHGTSVMGTTVLHEQTFAGGRGLFKGIDFSPSSEAQDKNQSLIPVGKKLRQWHSVAMTTNIVFLSERLSEPHPEPNDACDADNIGSRCGEEARVSC